MSVTRQAIGDFGHTHHDALMYNVCMTAISGLRHTMRGVQHLQRLVWEPGTTSRQTWHLVQHMSGVRNTPA